MKLDINLKNKAGSMWSTMRQGKGLSVSHFRNNAWLIVLIVSLALMLISMRYNTKTHMMEIKRLRSELEQAENHKLEEKALYMSLIRENDMVELSQRHHLGLEFQEQPPYILHVGEAGKEPAGNDPR